MFECLQAQYFPKLKQCRGWPTRRSSSKRSAKKIQSASVGALGDGIAFRLVFMINWVVFKTLVGWWLVQGVYMIILSNILGITVLICIYVYIYIYDHPTGESLSTRIEWQRNFEHWRVPRLVVFLDWPPSRGMIQKTLNASKALFSACWWLLLCTVARKSEG